jgi:hypothetical protein
MKAVIAALSVVLVVGCKKDEPPKPDPSPPPPSPSVSTAPAASTAKTAAVVDAGPSACAAAPPEKSSDIVSVARSHDGKSVAWTVSLPAAKKDDASTTVLCFERNAQRRVLITDRDPLSGDGGVEASGNGFYDLVFSRDDRVLFYASQTYAVSRGAYGIEVATGKSFFIVDGEILEELDRGPYKGSLYASHFRLDDEHPVGSPQYTGRGVVHSVVDWNGKTLKKLPGDELARKKILDGK